VVQHHILVDPNPQQHKSLFGFTHFYVMQVTSLCKGEGENTKGPTSCGQPTYSENV